MLAICITLSQVLVEENCIHYFQELFLLFIETNVSGNKQSSKVFNKPRSEKTGLRGFRPGLTQTGLYRTETRNSFSHRRPLKMAPKQKLFTCFVTLKDL